MIHHGASQKCIGFFSVFVYGTVFYIGFQTVVHELFVVVLNLLCGFAGKKSVITGLLYANNI
jgi:hypothetical protein